jgi:uncharacterized repeat protein (TIGR01451 family)
MGVLGTGGKKNLRVGLAVSLLSAAIITATGLVAGPTAFPAGTPVTGGFSSGDDIGGLGWTASAKEVNDDNETVPFEEVLPDISVVKTANVTSVPETGGNVTFSFVVANNSVEAATLTSLMDSAFGDLNGQGDCVVPQPLAGSGGTYSCAITEFLSGDASGPAHTNVVTATAIDDGGNEDEATDDEEIPYDDVPAEVSVVKTISSDPTDNLDGTFTIVYSINVTNAATAGVGHYDLADTATFSPGVTIESQAVTNTAPGSITTDAMFPTSGTIVTGQEILIGATHTYEVAVVATLAVDTSTTYLECSSTTGAAGEGLYNEAALTVDDVTTTDNVCSDIPGDLMIEKSDGGIVLQVGDGPFDYTLTVTNIGGASTGNRVTVTDVLPDEFVWFGFPDTPGDFPFCTQAAQVLTCELDPSAVDAGGESTILVLTAQAREDIPASEAGYRNLSYVDSPGDPAPPSPSCTAIGTATSSSFFTMPDNNTACEETPTRPAAVLPIEPPEPAPTPPPTTQPPATVPPTGLPATGSSVSPNTLGIATLLLGLGVGLTVIVRRPKQLS